MASQMSINGKVDVNTFVDQAAGLAAKLDAGTALILNQSGKTVQFYCYNGGDFVMAVPFSKPSIADGYTGTIAAGGSTFKVFADNKGDTEFLVKPRKAYLYEGRGKVTEMKK